MERGIASIVLLVAGVILYLGMKSLVVIKVRRFNWCYQCSNNIRITLQNFALTYVPLIDVTGD